MRITNHPRSKNLLQGQNNSKRKRMLEKNELLHVKRELQ